MKLCPLMSTAEKIVECQTICQWCNNDDNTPTCELIEQLKKLNSLTDTIAIHAYNET